MLLAMGLTAFACIFIGSFPRFLYDLLPYATDYQPYTTSHVLAQTQLLFFSALAFTLLLLSGIYPAEIRSINIDADWFYRKGGRGFYVLADKVFGRLNSWGDRIFVRQIPELLCRFFAEPGEKVQKHGLRLLAGAAGGDRDLSEEEAIIERRSRNAAYPVGIGVLLAVLFLTVISFLFFL